MTLAKLERMVFIQADVPIFLATAGRNSLPGLEPRV